MLYSLLSTLPDSSEATKQFSKALELILSLMVPGGDSSSNTIASAMEQFNTTYSLGLAVISLVLALLGCFFGYKLARFFMALSGFNAGLVIGSIIAVKLIKASNGIVILCALAGAFLFSIFAYAIYKAGIFVLCFFFSFTLAANLIPLTGTILFFACTVTGFVVGTLAIKYVRPVIILSSVIACAYIASRSLMTFGPLTGVAFFKQSYAQPVLFGGLFLAGTLVQFLSTSRDEPGNRRGKSKRR